MNIEGRIESDEKQRGRAVPAGTKPRTRIVRCAACGTAAGQATLQKAANGELVCAGGCTKQRDIRFAKWVQKTVAQAQAAKRKMKNKGRKANG